jgi:hypothetical protein
MDSPLRRTTYICITRWIREFNSSSVWSLLGAIDYFYVAVNFEWIGSTGASNHVNDINIMQRSNMDQSKLTLRPLIM